MKNKKKFIGKFKREINFKLINWFWVWIILIIDGDNGRDLLDVLISYLDKLN